MIYISDMRINISNIFNIRNLRENKYSNIGNGYNKLEKSPICDVVSFSGNKKDTVDFILTKFSKEELPESIYSELKTRSENGEGNKEINIYDVHESVYGKLKCCKSLDEAKKLYPEFSEVIDFKDIKTDSASKNKLFNDLLSGKNEEPEGGIALYLLKCIYKLIDDNSFDSKSLKNYAKFFNIPVLSKSYNIKLCKNLPAVREGISERAKQRWADPEFRQKMEEQVYTPEYRDKIGRQSKERWANPEYAQEMSRLSSERWNNPEYRELMYEIMHSDEFIEKDRQRGIQQWQDAEKVEEARKKTKKWWKSPQNREKIMSAINSPEVKQKQREQGKQRWKDPEYRAKMDAIMQSEGYIEHKREIMKARWENDEEYAQRMRKAPVLAWQEQELEDIREFGQKLRDENPYINVLFARKIQGENLTEYEENILKSYWQKFWSNNNASERYGKTLSEVHKKLKSEKTDNPET